MDIMRVVFCLPGNSFSSNFLIAWTRLIDACNKKGISIVMAPGVSSHVALARSKSFGYNVFGGENQKPFGGELDYDYIMCIDSDILFTPEHFFDMLESPHDVTSGLYIMSDNKHFTAVKDWDTSYFGKNGTFEFMTPEYIEKWKSENIDRYMKVVYSGLGWTLIKKGVLEKLTYPIFWSDVHRIPNVDTSKPDIVDMSSEDVSLFLNLGKVGVVSVIDTKIRVGHEKIVVL
jgi:hypothetical protein